MTRKFLFLLISALALGLLLVACGGGDADSPSGSDQSGDGQSTLGEGDAVAGESLYQGTCSACHGPDAKGLPNLGKDLTTSEFLKENTDDELLDFILVGRPISDPLNTQGVDMPPKGGNPALSNDDIYDIIAYLRSIEE